MRNLAWRLAIHLSSPGTSPSGIIKHSTQTEPKYPIARRIGGYAESAPRHDRTDTDLRISENRTFLAYISSQKVYRRMQTTHASKRLHNRPVFLCERWIDVRSIVVVHGLSGGPTSTWQHPASRAIWFRDLLPDDIANGAGGTHARIWTFGYNANVVFGPAPQAGAHTFAAELLGRIKAARKGFEALIEAHLNRQYESILRATVGILFLGTPHRGSHATNLGNIALQIAKKVPFVTPNLLIVNTLKRESPLLHDSVFRFPNIRGSIRIWSFFETQKTSGNMFSAITGLEGETQLPLNADHRGICRYLNRNDQNYVQVRESILELMIGVAIEELEARPSPPIRNHRPRTSEEGDTDSLTDGMGRVSLGDTDYRYSERRHGGTTTETRSQKSRTAPSFSRDVPPPRPSVADYPESEIAESPTYDWSATSQPPGMSRTPNPAQQRRRVPSPPRSSSSTHPAPQQRATTREQSSQPKKPSAASPTEPRKNEENLIEFQGWMCDVCMKDMQLNDFRVHCEVCEDYDLCWPCYESGVVSKKHTEGHRIRTSTTTIHVKPSQLSPAARGVCPEWSLGRSHPNWTNDKHSPQRWFHLREEPNHARFTVSNIDPGCYYSVTMYFDFRLSEHITPSVLDELKKSSTCTLRIAVGTPIGSNPFAEQLKADPFNELFSSSIDVSYKIGVPSAVKHSSVQTIEYSTLFALPKPLHFPDGQSVLGIMMEWSDVQSFATLDEAVLSMSVAWIRLDQLYDYEPPASPEPPAATPAAPAQQPSTGSLSILDMLFASVKGEEESKEEEDSFNYVYAVLSAQLEMQARINSQLTYGDLYRAIAHQRAQEEAEERMQNLVAGTILLRLQSYIEEQEKARKIQAYLEEQEKARRLQAYLEEQKRKRQQEAEAEQAGRLLGLALLGGFRR
ncbi:hypothetical protein K440DRAFT_636120 [Wilcoxina mikolae CBS 423.85]|nr:hypothetical protein K440DRAFT_636120 [Wilcoxina mikolae CBS 423.85]